MKKIRITYLLESTDLWGGVKVALEQSELLSEAGHSVTVLSKDSGPKWYPLKLPIFQVSDFNAATIADSDIIVGTYWTTVRAAYECGRGILVHLCQGYEADYKELSHLKAAIEAVYSYKIPKLTISPHLDKLLKERFDSDTHYIGQMLNKNIFYPFKKKKRLINIPNILGINPLKILVVGPFDVNFKNITTALNAILLAKKRFKLPIKLIRVSQFPISMKEKEIIRPDISHFHVPHQLMGEIYRNADLFISMSKEAEGFGLPAIEAMACGLPTILSKISSYTSLDEIPDYSFFVEPSDYESAAEAINEIYLSKTLRQRLISRGLKVVSQFTSEALLLRIEDAFERIINRAFCKRL